MPGVPARASTRARLGCRWRHPERVSVKGDGSFMSAREVVPGQQVLCPQPLGVRLGNTQMQKCLGPLRDAQWGLAIPSLYSGHSSPSLPQPHSLSCLLPYSSHLGLLSSSHNLNSTLPHTGFLPLPANTELNVCTGSDKLGTL